LLASQVFALVAVKAAGQRGSDEVAKDLGLHPFVVRKLGSLADRLSQTKVNQDVETIAKGDEQLKTTGAEPWQLIGRMLYAMNAR
jgi:DNA polymerase III delta subunit